MNKRKIAVGPGASSLILIAVVLSLCVLAVLTLVSARNDDSLGIRSAEAMERAYQLYDRAEQSLAKLDGVLAKYQKDASDQEAWLALVEDHLPEGMALEEDEVSWEETDGDRALECRVRLLSDDENKRTRWVTHRLTSLSGMEDEWEDEWED